MHILNLSNSSSTLKYSQSPIILLCRSHIQPVIYLLALGNPRVASSGYPRRLSSCPNWTWMPNQQKWRKRSSPPLALAAMVPRWVSQTFLLARA